jgi:hypothetical protein
MRIGRIHVALVALVLVVATRVRENRRQRLAAHPISIGRRWRNLARSICRRARARAGVGANTVTAGASMEIEWRSTASGSGM